MNTNVTIRMDEDLKAEADAVLAELGMSFTTAVNVFTRQVVRRRAIPFDVSAGPVPASVGGEPAVAGDVDAAAVAAAVAFAEEHHGDFVRLAQ